MDAVLGGSIDMDLLFEVKVAPPTKEVRIHFPGARQQAMELESSELVGAKATFSTAYSKGAAVVRMVEEEFRDTFLQGVRKCLMRHAYRVHAYKIVL